MKFIKTSNGGYVNTNCVKNFYLDVWSSTTLVKADTGEVACSLAEFTDKAEAQAYLDNLVAELNSGNTFLRNSLK